MSRRVSFRATKKVPKKVNVKFTTKEGKEVSFMSTKKVPKRVRVTFNKSSRRKRR